MQPHNIVDMLTINPNPQITESSGSQGSQGSQGSRGFGKGAQQYVWPRRMHQVVEDDWGAGQARLRDSPLDVVDWVRLVRLDRFMADIEDGGRWW